MEFIYKTLSFKLSIKSKNYILYIKAKVKLYMKSYLLNLKSSFLNIN